MQLDLQTLTVGSVITAIISALFFIAIWQLNRRVEGIIIWLFAVLLQPSAMFAISLRGQVPDLISIMLGNYLLLTSLILFYIGVRVFFNLPSYLTRTLLIFTPPFLLSFSYFTYVEPNTLMRVCIVYSVAIGFYLLSIRTLRSLAPKQQSKGTNLYIVMCSFVTLLLLIRLIVLISSQQLPHLYDLNYSNLIGTVTSFVVPQAQALAVFILAFERRELKVLQFSEIVKQESELKTRYLATLSHEIRTPINGMMGIAQVILDKLQQKTPTTESTIPLLNTIVSSGQQVVELADNILEYSLLEQKQQLTRNESKIDLFSFVDDLAQLASPLAQKKQLSFSYTIGPDVPEFIEIDATKLKAVLLNLISNGIKYTEQGSVILKVEVDSKQDKLLRFSVVDTGIGMDDLSFQQFSQAFTRGSTETTKEHGAGLGLFIVKTMLQTLKGSIDYRANQPNGSVVTISLPFSVASAPDILPENEHKQDKTTRALNILLVEDIPLNIEVVSALLIQQGHTVTSAQTGQAAKEKLSKQSFDRILLDIQLPDVVGLELYHYIAAQVPDTPIILLTAALTQDDLLQYEKLNIAGLVKKPIIKEKLLTALNHNLPLPFADNTDASSFSASTFKLLETTLPKSLLTEKIEQLPTELLKCIEQIKQHHNASERQHKERLCHKASSYFGQFGLLRVKQQIASAGSSATITETELTQLVQLLETDLPLLEQHWQKVANED